MGQIGSDNLYVMSQKMVDAVEHSCSSLRLLEGVRPDPRETGGTTKLSHLTEAERALPLVLILSAREL